jgi:hypothetical protein
VERNFSQASFSDPAPLCRERWRPAGEFVSKVPPAECRPSQAYAALANVSKPQMQPPAKWLFQQRKSCNSRDLAQISATEKYSQNFSCASFGVRLRDFNRQKTGRQNRTFMPRFETHLLPAEKALPNQNPISPERQPLAGDRY